MGRGFGVREWVIPAGRLAESGWIGVVEGEGGSVVISREPLHIPACWCGPAPLRARLLASSLSPSLVCVSCSLPAALFPRCCSQSEGLSLVVCRSAFPRPYILTLASVFCSKYGFWNLKFLHRSKSEKKYKVVTCYRVV